MFSRRGILGLFGVSALPIEAKPAAPKPTFIKGMVVPSIREHLVPEYPSHVHTLSDPGHMHYPARVVREIEYQIFDGKQFVALESEAGQRVIADLS